MKNDFSVLMSVYHKENPSNLKESINSILNQTLRPYKIVLIKDGPTTNELEEIINTFSDKFPELFKIVALDKNKGLGQALNIGIKHCETELVARMDTDDICYVDRFEKQIGYISKKPNLSVLGCSIQEFDNAPKDLGVFKSPPANGKKLINFAKFRNPLNHPSVIFRKSHVLKAGSYINMPLFEDYYLWVRMLKLGFEIENLQEPLLHFRVGNEMIARRHGLSYLKNELNFLRAIRKLGFINDFELSISLIIKLPLRLLPKKLLKLLYNKSLRQRKA